MKKFTTIFPFAANVHLTKDIGQVANTLAFLGEYESTLVCYKQQENYPSLETEAANLKIDFIEPIGIKLFMEKAILRYLKENALKIDVLHFFKFTKETIYYGLYYKKLNPKGKVYVKLDVVNQHLIDGVRYSKKKIFNWFHKRVEAAFFKKVSLLSAENPTALELIEKHYLTLKDRTILLTNGVNNTYLQKTFPTIKSYEEKENIILTVGRLGSKEKKYELLLEAFAAFNVTDWKLVLVGPTENDFELRVQEIIAQRPELKSSIILTGAVEDRKELYDYYNRSKICCLASDTESFGIVFVEAMYFGNYLIGTTGMSAFQFITDNYRLGSAIEPDNKAELISLLEKVTCDDEFLRRNYPEAIQQVKDKFYWTNIIPELSKRLSAI